jgi:tRNA dimethylallyltransferase
MQFVPKINSPLIAIVGPTGVGKTEIAVRLAQDLNGEIISADSRQVYRYMNIGTAKPTSVEQSQAQHHLIDFLDPDQDLSLAQFQRMAYDAIDELLSRNKLPLFVGGTGQYMNAVIEGWGIPEVAPHLELRADLEAFSESFSSTVLHAWLNDVDHKAAQSIDWRNVRRVVRALEVYLIAGKPISVLQERHPPPYQTFVVGFTRPRDELYERVDQRIDKMIEQGLVNEVRTLLDRGYSWALPSMSSLGYPEIGAYLRDEITLDEALLRMKRFTRDFIRHQYTWFSPNNTAIRWFDLTRTSYDEIRAAIENWLGG